MGLDTFVNSTQRAAPGDANQQHQQQQEPQQLPAGNQRDLGQKEGVVDSTKRELHDLGGAFGLTGDTNQQVFGTRAPEDNRRPADNAMEVEGHTDQAVEEMKHVFNKEARGFGHCANDVAKDAHAMGNEVHRQIDETVERAMQVADSAKEKISGSSKKEKSA